MPEYSFQCQKCAFEFSKVWSIADYDTRITNVKCPFCKSKKVCRDYEEDKVVVNYIGGLHECETIGEYADKQTAKLSEDEKNERLAGFVTKKQGGMKELPSGMSRMKDPGAMPSPLTKTKAKRKRKKKK
jgi:transcription initiation factor TFIIIB Brf1 subunit/transcription initiation factor TFIIB